MMMPTKPLFHLLRTLPTTHPCVSLVLVSWRFVSGCIVSLMAAITAVACTKSEEDVAMIIGLIGAILGEMDAHGGIFVDKL